MSRNKVFRWDKKVEGRRDTSVLGNDITRNLHQDINLTNNKHTNRSKPECKIQFYADKNHPN